MGKEDTISRASNLLLQGWRMIFDQCPSCNTPLLQKKTEYYCPGCDLPLVLESEGESNSRTPEVSSSFNGSPISPNAPIRNTYSSPLLSSTKTPSAESTMKSPEVQRESMEERKREYDRKNQSRNLISSKLGEKMLQGWAMLGLICPNNTCNGTPLMRKGSDNLCVCCDTVFTLDDEGYIVDSRSVGANAMTVSSPKDISKDAKSESRESLPNMETIENKQIDMSPVVEHANTPAKEADFDLTPKEGDGVSDDTDLDKEEHGDNEEDVEIQEYLQPRMDASRLLADAMLRGSALLAEVCTCMTPLVRDRNGEKRCVLCGPLNQSVNLGNTASSMAALASETVTTLTSANNDDEMQSEEASSDSGSISTVSEGYGGKSLQGSAKIARSSNNDMNHLTFVHHKSVNQTTGNMNITNDNDSSSSSDNSIESGFESDSESEPENNNYSDNNNKESAGDDNSVSSTSSSSRSSYSGHETKRLREGRSVSSRASDDDNYVDDRKVIVGILSGKMLRAARSLQTESEDIQKDILNAKLVEKIARAIKAVKDIKK